MCSRALPTPALPGQVHRSTARSAVLSARSGSSSRVLSATLRPAGYSRHMAVADLPAHDRAGWARATRHPVLTAVREGTVPEAAFNAWLVQDYRFVTDLLRFQARLLARAPRAAQPMLANGAAALVDELAWFEHHARRRGLDLSAPPLPATVGYAELLARLDGADVAVALAMLWTLERVYLDAWSHAARGAPVYRGFVDH